MPLPPPAPREHIHTRRVACRGYRRADGLWDIEGHLTDAKTYAFDNEHRGRIGPGTPLHEMWLRITVDDRMEIKGVEAATDAGPFAVCPAVAPNFQRLVGLRIGRGFTRQVKDRVGGVQGCTHLVELLGPMATTAFQTITPILARERAAGGDEAADAARQAPALLNSCHAFASDGEVVRRLWPAFYTGAGPAPE